MCEAKDWKHSQVIYDKTSQRFRTFFYFSTVMKPFLWYQTIIPTLLSAWAQLGAKAIAETLFRLVGRCGMKSKDSQHPLSTPALGIVRRVRHLSSHFSVIHATQSRHLPEAVRTFLANFTGKDYFFSPWFDIFRVKHLRVLVQHPRAWLKEKIDWRIPCYLRIWEHMLRFSSIVCAERNYGLLFVIFSFQPHEISVRK